MNAATRIETTAMDEWEWVEQYLDTWARFMREDDTKAELGMPTKSPVFLSGGGGYGKVSDDWQAEIDERAINVVKAALEDMPPVESAAVMHIKLAAVFKFQREDPLQIYLRARQKIGVRLRAANFI
jgi:hypothetical protein